MTAWTDVLSGRRIYLDVVHGGNAQGLHAVLSEPGLIDRWPLRGLTLSPAEFCSFVQSAGEATFVVCSRFDDGVIGMVGVKNLSYQDQTCEIVLALGSHAWKAGWPFEAILLILRYVFQSLGMRRAHFRMGDAILERFGHGTIGMLEKEGVLRSHSYIDGGFEDVHLFSVSSESWLPFSNLGY